MLKMASKKEHKIPLIIITIIVCIPLALGLAYKYRGELRLNSKFTQIRKAFVSSQAIVVKVDFFTKVNGKDLRVIFAIPCKDMKTKEDILNNMTRIKHEMLMSMENEQNRISIEKRDFRRIKANCLEILKKYAPVDVSKVYMDFFAHN